MANTKILLSTSDSNKLIADVYAFRADFVRDHPDIIQGFVASIFKGIDALDKDSQPACQSMADAFGMTAKEVMDMRGDAHLTNFAENVNFFLNASSPVNFERTWKNMCLPLRILSKWWIGLL
jgi:NitT/TauT family transport system substrate-binding protein